MVIEWLEFEVIPESREKFIEIDRRIWTATLKNFPGFLGKEVWVAPSQIDRVFLVIRWQTREQWKSIPQEILTQTDQKFAEQVGQDNYKSVRLIEYQVH